MWMSAQKRGRDASREAESKARPRPRRRTCESSMGHNYQNSRAILEDRVELTQKQVLEPFRAPPLSRDLEKIKKRRKIFLQGDGLAPPPLTSASFCALGDMKSREWALDGWMS